MAINNRSQLSVYFKANAPAETPAGGHASSYNVYRYESINSPRRSKQTIELEAKQAHSNRESGGGIRICGGSAWFVSKTCNVMENRASS
jgi:hypothetical protein